MQVDLTQSIRVTTSDGRPWLIKLSDLLATCEQIAADGGLAPVAQAVPASPLAGERYSGFGADHFYSSTDLTGAPKTIALPGDTRFAYIEARLRHVRSVNNGVDLWLRLNADTGANYSWAVEASTTAPAQAPNGVAGDTKIVLSNSAGINNTATKGWSGDFCLIDPGETAHHKVVKGLDAFWLNTSSGVNVSIKGGAVWLSTAAITGLSFLFSDGSNFAEGKCELYGILAD